MADDPTLTEPNLPGGNESALKKCDRVRNLINPEDLSAITKEQKSMLEQLEKMNQMLINCNNISERQYNALVSRFQRHTNMLCNMKKDLHAIHSRVRRLKTLVHEKHPESAWSVVEQDGKINSTDLLTRDYPSINDETDNH